MLGLAALRDVERVREFAEIVRQEYVAVGIRAALHPTLDLATEPRWARQAQTFGQDPGLVTEFGVAYVQGLQGEDLGPGSLACCAKHFPGGGPRKDGEDAHFPYGREQVYTSGSQEKHLRPFPAAIEAGVAAVMPYYSMPVGLTFDGQEIEPVGFAYNRQVATGLLRGRLGFEGVVLSDWELVNDNIVGAQVLPARAWGVKHLDPLARMERRIEGGCDQFGGEECVEVLADLVASGRVSETRIDESARRLLVVKFRLGLFDDPYVDEDAARLGEVTLPEEAYLAVIRPQAPFEPRSDLFLESWFHQGSLDFPPGLPVRIGRIAEHYPVVFDVFLDRPAVLTPFLDVASVVVVNYGTSGPAFLDALTGAVPPRGRLPFALPVSMPAVRRSPGGPAGLEHPLFECGGTSCTADTLMPASANPGLVMAAAMWRRVPLAALS